MIRNKVTRVKTAKYRKKSSNAWLQRQLNDPYVVQAKKDGYRSRAAYKLIEINDKFKILKKGKIVIDLGAAPGGWSQVACKIVGQNHVFAIDILSMEQIPGVNFVQLDFLSENAHEIIIDNIKNNLGKYGKNSTLENNNLESFKCDIVLSDMAANTSGDSKTDHLRIVNILEESLEFSKKILAKDGSFVGKIFQGGASGELLKIFKDNFTIVKHFKPNSSRKESAENYIIAIGFKNINL